MLKAEIALRADFAVSVLFHPELHAGHPGFLRKAGDGTFAVERAETLFQGYMLARNADDAQLKRFSPNRTLVIGMLRQINDTLESKRMQPVSVSQVRIILKVVGGIPTT